MTDIDAAVAVELEALALQKPMNEVIDQGDSAVQQMYCDKTIFITGGCGFMGKQLIEKLFRACKIKKMFVLIRSKKDKTIQQRLDTTLFNPVYDTLRKKQPDFADRIVPIDGNVSELALGLSEADWKLLTEEVNIIFHAAATVRFDAHIREATLTNVRGTREVLKLARECKQFIKFVHVSTAFTHATRERINTDVLEEFYSCPVPPNALISFAEEVDEKRLDDITKGLIDGWPNTYTFTKAVTEELMRTTARDLPVCIVRPPIVIPAYYEPSPGWLDFNTLAGPSGIYFAILLGVLKVFCVDVNNHLSMAPVDLVNNAIIASVWDSNERKKNGENNIPVYTISLKRIFQWSTLGYHMRYDCTDLLSPRAIWYCALFETKYRPLYMILAFFFHYVPAFTLDIICAIIGKKPKEMTSFVDIYRKIDKLSRVYDYFLQNEWNFRDDNVQAMINRMSSADKAIFNCDLRCVNLTQYIMVWGIGLRKFILHDGLKDSAKGVRNQRIFAVLNAIVFVLYMYILWLVFTFIFKLLLNVFV